MKIFDRKGMMIIPNPVAEQVVTKKLLILNELYCPDGHTLISNRCSFNGHQGILLKTKKGRKKGFVALSPIFGQKARINFDIGLKSNELLKLYCPECECGLPAYSLCTCGADLIALFLKPTRDFSNCVGICNRVDCPNAQIIKGGELISQSMIDTY